MPGAQCKSPLLRLSATAYALSLLCSVLATPAQAQTCDQYDGTRTAKDLEEIRNEVQSYLPARYFDTIGGLVFEMVEPDDEDSVFPRAIPSRNRVEIPSDYYRVHCQMIAFTERLMRIPKARSLEVLLSLWGRHRRCLRRSSFNLCFRQSLQTEIADLEPESSYDQEAPERVRDAFFLVIAHEIAHVLIRQRYSDDLFSSLDHPELAADALALQAAILAGRDYRRAGLALFPASFFGRDVEFEDHSPELRVTDRADSSCRSALAFATGASWGPEINAGLSWAITNPAEAGGGSGSPSLTAEADRARLQMRTNTGGLDFAAICRLPSAQIQARGREYRSLLVEIDRVNASFKSPDIAFRALIKVRPQSDAARSFIHTIIVYRITNEMMTAYDRKDLATQRKLFETLRQIRPQIDRDSLASVTRGMLSMFAGLNTKRFAPPGSSLDEIVSATESDLLDAERFLIEPPANLSSEIARLRLLQGDCAGAYRRFAFQRASSVASVAAEAERYSFLEGISRSSCEEVVAKSRSELRTKRGWK